MVQNRERQPHNQLRLFVGYGLQLTLALVGGACLDLPKHSGGWGLKVKEQCNTREVVVYGHC